MEYDGEVTWYLVQRWSEYGYWSTIANVRYERRARRYASGYKSRHRLVTGVRVVRMFQKGEIL